MTGFKKVAQLFAIKSEKALECPSCKINPDLSEKIEQTKEESQLNQYLTISSAETDISLAEYLRLYRGPLTWPPSMISCVYLAEPCVLAGPVDAFLPL